MTDVQKAEQIISELKAKRNEIIELEFSLSKERQSIAFEAHTGDEKARRRLDQINRTAAQHGSELESLDAAIAEAENRWKQAQGEEAREADRADALKLKDLFGELSDLILQDDDLLVEYVRNRNREEKIWHEVRSLGWHQTIAQLRANTSRIAARRCVRLLEANWSFPFYRSNAVPARVTSCKASAVMRA
jgi:hypothetical protein